MKYYYYLWRVRYHATKGHNAFFMHQDKESSDYHGGKVDHYTSLLTSYLGRLA